MVLMDRLEFLAMEVIIVLQLFVFSLLAPIYGAVLAIVGAVYVVYYLIMGEGFDTTLLLEPLMWTLNQTRAFFGMDSFKAAPYL